MHRVNRRNDENMHDIVWIQVIIQTSRVPFFGNVQSANHATEHWHSILKLKLFSSVISNILYEVNASKYYVSIKQKLNENSRTIQWRKISLFFLPITSIKSSSIIFMTCNYYFQNYVISSIHVEINDYWGGRWKWYRSRNNFMLIEWGSSGGPVTGAQHEHSRRPIFINQSS